MNSDKQRRTVKFQDRCTSPHAGSSTCTGCDPDYWILTYDELEVKNQMLNEQNIILAREVEKLHRTLEASMVVGKAIMTKYLDEVRE